MKVVVMSDSHGNEEIVGEVYRHWEKEAQIIFHCGDSELPSSDKIWDHFTVVKGNMDFDSGYPEEQMVKIGRHTIFITHGHLYGINYSFDRLMYKAEEVGADIIFYGHLHKIACEKKAGFLMLNPGSIEQPRGDLLIKAYAVLDITDDEIKVQYYTNGHEAIKELAFTYMGNNTK